MTLSDTTLAPDLAVDVISRLHRPLRFGCSQRDNIFDLKKLMSKMAGLSALAVHSGATWSGVALGWRFLKFWSGVLQKDCNSVNDEPETFSLAGSEESAESPESSTTNSSFPNSCSNKTRDIEDVLDKDGEA